MSRKVRKIPRALRREKPTRREGNPDAWLEQQMQAANLSSFVSSEPTHSKPRQLRRVEPKRRTRENFHDEYGGGGGDYRSSAPSDVFMAAGSTFSWRADGSVVYDKLCAPRKAR